MNLSDRSKRYCPSCGHEITDRNPLIEILDHKYCFSCLNDCINNLKLLEVLTSTNDN